MEYSDYQKNLVRDFMEYLTSLEWDSHIIETDEIPMGECAIEMRVLKYAPNELKKLMKLLNQLKNASLMTIVRDEDGLYRLFGSELFARINKDIYA